MSYRGLEAQDEPKKQEAKDESPSLKYKYSFGTVLGGGVSVVTTPTTRSFPEFDANELVVVYNGLQYVLGRINGRSETSDGNYPMYCVTLERRWFEFKPRQIWANATSIQKVLWHHRP